MPRGRPAPRRRGAPVQVRGVSAMLPEMLEVLLRVLLWAGLPLLLVVLGIGPRRVWGGMKKAWAWLWQRRLDPEEVLTRVVQGH